MNLVKKIKQFPNTPGVYFFLGPKRKILYVGKATSLKSRVRSYFQSDLAETRSPLIAKLVKRAETITFEKTDSVLEALILEAHYIKKFQPPYNTDEKDDKSFNYVVITKEDFPRVLVVRGKDLAEQFPKKKTKYQFGPFPQGTSLREAMKLVRKIFPFRDNCTPAQRKLCFNAQIGLCPGVCSGIVSKKEYGKTIRNIKLFFEGKKKLLVIGLKRDMRSYAKQQEFEKAARARKSLFALTHIQDIALIKRELKIPHHGMAGAFRVEAYDVAHLSGTGTVGVFTVVEDGQAKKSDYRMFRIRSAPKGSDTDALKEVLLRRLRHGEWPLPQLFVTDGGVGQKNAAEAILRKAGVEVPVVSVVKDEHHRPREILGEGDTKHRREREILLANSEAHRFAIKYHRKVRGR